MTAYQTAKLLMAKGVSAFLEENTAIISAVAAIVTAFDALKAKIIGIDDTAELNSLSIAGITTDKRNSKGNVCILTSDIAGMMSAYAAATGNNELKQETNLSVSKLKRKADAELIQTCQAIHDLANEIRTELADYGVTGAMISELQQKINEFAAEAPKPRTAISVRKTRREIINQQFDELDEILNDRLDALMGNFRTSHPEFYRTYFNLREIHDPATTPTQLKGVITDNADNSLLKNAIITIVELNKTAKSDTQGEYLFKPVAFGTYSVTVTKEGYQDFQTDGIEVKLGDITHLNVKLTAI